MSAKPFSECRTAEDFTDFWEQVPEDVKWSAIVIDNYPDGTQVNLEIPEDQLGGNTWVATKVLSDLLGGLGKAIIRGNAYTKSLPKIMLTELKRAKEAALLV